MIRMAWYKLAPPNDSLTGSNLDPIDFPAFGRQSSERCVGFKIERISCHLPKHVFLLVWKPVGELPAVALHVNSAGEAAAACDSFGLICSGNYRLFP